MAKRLWIQLRDEKNSTSITLPINPENINIETERKIQTYNILRYGEVPVSGDQQLQRLKLTSFLPDKDSYLALLASYIDKTIYKPYSTVETAKTIDEWVKNSTIIRVIVADGLNEGVNKEFYVEKFTKTMHENTANLDYELDLVEYVNPKRQAPQYLTNTKKLQDSIIGGIQKLYTRATNRTIPSELVVKSGQTIYKIARLYYGGKKHNELAKLNHIYDLNKDLGGQVIEMLPL